MSIHTRGFASTKGEHYMKASYYNFFFPYEADENKVIAYNSFSNALALMDKPKHDVFHRFVNDGIPIEDEEFVGQLKDGYFLINDEVNELERIRFKMLQSRYSTNFLSLTIAPTADCNFRCTYCYEKDVIKPDYMSDEVENAIINLVEKQAKTISGVSVSWFGGEPLMNLDKVKSISTRLIDLCEKESIGYHASMITNGYLLARETVQVLNTMKVSSLQITLDGCENIHNKRRPLADGSATFEAIIKNLESCIDILPPVGLRINIDKNNLDSGREVWNLLKEKGLLEKVKPYLGKVVSGEDDGNKTHCLDTCGFSQEDFNFYNEFYSDNMFMGRYPKRLYNYCGADRINSYTIAANGRIYKCWHDIGEHKSCVGCVLSGQNVEVNEELRLKYILFDPTMDDICKHCNLLPLCMGGCPYYRLRAKDDKNSVCSMYKFTLDNFLSVISQRLKLNVSNKA